MAKDREVVRKVGESIEQLPVVLTFEERLEYADRLAEQESKLRDHESHVEEVKKRLTAEKTAIASERYRLAGIVRNRAHVKDVRVSVFHHYDDGVVRFVRDDTGEVTTERPMRNDERQVPIDLAKPLKTIEGRKKEPTLEAKKPPEAAMTTADDQEPPNDES